MLAVALILDWYGPFKTLEQARDYDDDEILYMGTGKVSRARKHLLQYVGIANDSNARLINNHKKLSLIQRERAVWVGYIGSHSIAGRRKSAAPRKHRVEVETAESGLVYFLQLSLNNRKRSKPPSRSFVLFNRWHTVDKTRRKKRPHSDWPDLIEYDCESDTAALIWFGNPRKIRRLTAVGIKALARIQTETPPRPS